MSRFILTSAKAQKVKRWLKKQHQQWKKGLKVLWESSEMTVSGTYIRHTQQNENKTGRTDSSWNHHHRNNSALFIMANNGYCHLDVI